MKNTNMLKKIIAAALTVAMMFTMSAGVFATGGETHNSGLSMATTFVTQKVAETIRSMEESTWTQETSVSDVIPLYDTANAVNGYIFNLVDSGQECGYMQIAIVEDTISIINYGFYGRHFYDKMLAAYFTKNPQQSRSINNVIYNGGLDYFIAGDTYYNIYTQKEETQSTEEIQSKYTFFTNKLSAEINSPTTYATPVKKYVTGATYEDLVEMNDFEGLIYTAPDGSEYTVTSHCAPTAATNLVKYWANRRNVSNLYYDSDWWVFSSLAAKMNYVGAGVLTTDFIPGLKAYSKSVRGVDYKSSTDKTTGLSFSLAKTTIGNNIPFKFGIPEHAEVCFGYNITESGSEQLIINTGWDKYWTFQSFTSIDMTNLQYVAW